MFRRYARPPAEASARNQGAKVRRTAQITKRNQIFFSFICFTEGLFALFVFKERRIADFACYGSSDDGVRLAVGAWAGDCQHVKRLNAYARYAGLLIFCFHCCLLDDDFLTVADVNAAGGLRYAAPVEGVPRVGGAWYRALRRLIDGCGLIAL